MVKHLIDFNDISVERWEKIHKLAVDIKNNPEKYAEECKGKILATLFYEPSTRTMLSFQTAMLRLGGSVIGFDNPSNSSVSKGENLKDTIAIVSSYVDLLVMRHPLEGAAMAASMFSSKPVINAGDGGHLHPTQTLTDLTTIMLEKGKLTGLNIGFCGDLKNGRTVHSLLKAFLRYKGNKFYFISTKKLNIPDYLLEKLKETDNEFVFAETLEECMGDIDVLYMTRIQRERFDSEKEYLKQKGVFILDTEKMEKAKKDLIVLHPLPKVDEIDIEVDDDPRAKYFEQAENGVYVRMALIMTLLSENNEELSYNFSEKRECSNPKCITQTERYLKTVVDEDDREFCKYCNHKLI
ncbi:MAG: aspartate carbamoyltransferase [Clostridia bacterium]|nr:aspartate carbamoyltransferase [Clostridia bacterium]